jgi:hypothetical protein
MEVTGLSDIATEIRLPVALVAVVAVVVGTLS